MPGVDCMACAYEAVIRDLTNTWYVAPVIRRLKARRDEIEHSPFDAERAATRLEQIVTQRTASV